MLTSCTGDDRDEDMMPGQYGDGGLDETGDGGGTASDDGAGTGSDDGGDDSGDTGRPPGDDGGGTDGADGGDGADDGGSEGAPDCRSMWVGQYIPSTEYMSMKVPETADEMFCYVNMNRINYQFHGRNDGCIWGGGGNGGDVSWPYEMDWDADLTARAQAEAERVAGGGQPNGVPENNGIDHTIYADGCASAEYTVTSPNDSYDDWADPAAGYFPDKAAGLSKSNGTARMGVHYYDPGSAAPTLTKMGVGLVEVGETRHWVVKFAQ